MPLNAWLKQRKAEQFQEAVINLLAADDELAEDHLPPMLVFEAWRIFMLCPHSYEDRKEVYQRVFNDIRTPTGHMYEDLAHRAHYILTKSLLASN